MGSGARSYDSITKCKNCSGSGFEKRKSLFDILFQTERDLCAKCEGKGFFINEYCNSCQGTGISLQKDIIEIELPKEIGPGMVMRIGRNGHAGPYQGLFGELTLKFL
jgi:molecular chaperone DnaJ